MLHPWFQTSTLSNIHLSASIAYSSLECTFETFACDLAKLQCNWCCQMTTMVTYYDQFFLHVHFYGWKPEEIHLGQDRKPVIFLMCLGKIMELWFAIFFFCYSCAVRSNCSGSGVLNLWVVIPLGAKWPFHRGHISGILHITIHNSSKIAVKKWQQKNFMVGITKI